MFTQILIVAAIVVALFLVVLIRFFISGKVPEKNKKVLFVMIVLCIGLPVFTYWLLFISGLFRLPSEDVLVLMAFFALFILYGTVYSWKQVFSFFPFWGTADTELEMVLMSQDAEDEPDRPTIKTAP